MKSSYTKRKIILLLSSVSLFMFGLAYGAVPIYRLFCQVTGYGGTTQVKDKVSTLVQGETKLIRVRFESDVSDRLLWEFVPLQKEIILKVGESALAFYKARNLTDQPLTGVATYNVTPQVAGVYFNKIQCFCFEEQKLLPGEWVEMPVFFFIDSDFLTDHRMHEVDTITLSYTFFKSV
uniref:Cox11 n=1 Tax=Meteora sporadica TaxID=2913902 RepID=UPI003002C0FE|nr:Cox11 [Meteora sporadica]WVH37101.1 Cox11 [Meteora sporadica]